GTATQLRAGALVRTSRPIRAIAHHRRVGIGDGQDPRLQRDPLAAERARVAAAVGALAVAEDPLADVLEADVGDQGGAELGVAVHLDPLGRRQRSALADDLGRYLVTALAAHERGEAHARNLLTLEAELARGQLRQMRDEPPRARLVLDASD